MLAAAWLAGHAACDVTTSCLAPDASEARAIAGHRVEVRAEGARHVGMDGAGGGHLGIFWPAIDGAGYRIHVRIDDRPEVEIGWARMDEDRVPDEDELRALAAAVEVAVAPSGEHVAIRRRADEDWWVMHLLSAGPPFRSERSAHFAAASVAAGALDFSSLPSAEELAIAILRDPREGPSASMLLTLQDVPPGPPFDEELLAMWPDDPRVHGLVTARVRPDSGARPAYREAVVAKAMAGLRDRPGHAALEADVVAQSTRDPAALRALDEALVALFPRDDAAEALRVRLGARRDYAMAGDVRASALAAARAHLEDEGPARDRAATIYCACESTPCDEHARLFAAGAVPCEPPRRCR